VSHVAIIALALVINGAVVAVADSLRLAGEPFQSTAPIKWIATNALPERLPVYKTVAQNFSEAVISNAMAIGSFQALNRVPSADKGLLHFADKRENMSRFLRIIPSQGWIRYHDMKAEGPPVHGVPSFEELEKLALSYVARLGADVSQLASKPRPRSETTMTSFDKKGGQQTNKVVSARYITMFRQIDGIDLSGKCFSIEVGNNARVVDLELSWRRFESVGSYKTLSGEKIVDCIRNGKAVIPPGVIAPPTPEALLITRVTPWYVGTLSGVAQNTIYPVANLEMIATTGAGTNFTFTAQCPIIDDESVSP